MKLVDLFEEALPQNFDDIVAILKRDCKQVIDKIENRFFLRGVRASSVPLAEFSKKNIRPDRKPMSTDLAMHHAMDNWFNEKFGFKARSAALFTTGDFKDARSYGAVYAIFPIGDFRFIWSEVIGDLFISMRDPERMGEILDDANYKDTDLESALSSGHEIMLSCKEYYALRIRSQNDIEALWQALKE